MPLVKIRHTHYHSTIRKEDLMAISKEFQAQLDRLSALVSADRTNEAVTIQKAVQAQAEADQAAIANAKAEAEAQVADAMAQLTQANQDLTDQVAALQAVVDAATASDPNPPAAPAPDGGTAPAAGDASAS